MDYVSPTKVVAAMLDAGATKANAEAGDLLVRGFLSGALLGFATSLAITASVQTSLPIVGAILFPVGFVMIVLLGLELVTGNFALVTIALIDGRCTVGQMLRNFGLVFLGNLLGSLCYAVFLWISLTSAGNVAPDVVGQKIMAIAVNKTQYPASGFGALIVKSVLCNWMVCLGAVLAMSSTSTMGKIAASWLPILVFFAHGYEHSVVNMFVIPAGIMLGAKVTVVDWWLKNQLVVTLGNFAGGSLFTGLALYYTHGRNLGPPPTKPSGVEPTATRTDYRR
jgi:formate transporter